MIKTRKARFATAIFTLLVFSFIYAIYGLFTSDFNVMSLKWVGMSFSVGFFFVFIMMGRSFGYIKALLAMLGIAVTIALMMYLNSLRAWPFGMSVYHDVLGWQFQRVSWSVPVIWAAITGGMLTLKKPEQIPSDPKVLFSWAFDTALIVMVLSIVIEPMARLTNAVTWVSQGAILGVPLSAFLGWFITSFIASFVGMMILRPWTKKSNPVHHFLPLAFAGFFTLIFILSTRLDIALIQLISAVFVIYFLIWTLRYGKNQNDSITVIESTHIEITQK